MIVRKKIICLVVICIISLSKSGKFVNFITRISDLKSANENFGLFFNDLTDLT